MTFKFQKNNWLKRTLLKKPAYTYTLIGEEDIIGEIEFNTPKEITPDQADAITLTIMKLKGTTGNIGDITYTYKPVKEWDK